MYATSSERVVAAPEHGGVGEQPDEVLLVRQERPPARAIAGPGAARVVAPGVAAESGGCGTAVSVSTGTASPPLWWTPLLVST